MWTTILFALPVAALLTWAAVTDARSRLIPNTVPITLLVLAALGTFLPPDNVFFLPVTMRLAALAVTAAILLWVSRHGGLGGGDFKLLPALAALFGLTGLCAILILTLPAALLWAWRRNTKTVPLAVFTAPGTVVFIILTMIFER